MPSDSIAGFLDHAQASQVLFPEQVEQLIRQPDIPQNDLDALCEYLEERGALTRFQADALRDGRGHELNFASYPVIDVIGPCPGGMAYRALHPSLRTPVVLRRLRADYFAPTDTPSGFVHRARMVGSVPNPFVVTVLDAGTHREQTYVVLDEPADSSDLESLVNDIGPMPGFLAAEYGRQVASALRSAHERGSFHGDVRPGTVVVAPVGVKTAPDGTLKKRPAPNATARLAELGLVPVRPPAAVSPPPDAALAYLPPERVDAATYDPRGDLYGLGTTLYYLLTGRAPFKGAGADLLNKVRIAAPAPLSQLRPDIPPELAAFVHVMMSKSVNDRPPTAADVEAGLAAFCRPGAVAVPTAVPASGVLVAEAVDAEPEAHQEEESWGVGNTFTAAAAASRKAPKKAVSADDKRRFWRNVMLGGGLHLIAVIGLVLLLTGYFNKKPQADPPKTAPAKDKDKNKKS